QDRELRTVTLPAVTFDDGAAPVPSRTRWLLAAITGAALLAVALVVWPKRHVLAEARRRRRASYEAGAEGRFARLEHACRAGDAPQPTNALLAWLDCIHRGTGSATIEDDLLARHPDADLECRTRELESAVLRGQTARDGGLRGLVAPRTRR